MPPHVLNQSSIHRRGRLWAIARWLALCLAAALHVIGPPRLQNISVAPITHNELLAVSFFADGTKPPSLPFHGPIENDRAAQLFGLETEPVVPGVLPEKWGRVLAAIAEDLVIVAQCHANGFCPLAAQRLIEISATGAGRSARARVGLINRAADLAISPVSDEAQWGIADHWSDPLETLQSNRGDCEDYAIVKYAALLNAGFPNDDVKIVILKNLFPNEDHAAVATRVDSQWLILDNRTLTLVHDTDITRAIPKFVLDHEGVKRFKLASRNSRAVS